MMTSQRARVHREGWYDHELCRYCLAGLARGGWANLGGARRAEALWLVRRVWIRQADAGTARAGLPADINLVAIGGAGRARRRPLARPRLSDTARRGRRG